MRNHLLSTLTALFLCQHPAAFAIGEIILDAPPETHTSPETAEFLGVLRTGDLPQNLALLYPRPITFVGTMPPAFEWTKQVYEKLGAGDRIRVVRQVREWKPQMN